MPRYIVTTPTRDREQWLRQLRTMSAMADGIARRLVDRAHATLAEAHCSIMNYRNALIAYEQGQPWRDVNYSLVRRADWLIRRSWEPRRIVERWYDRTYWEANPHAVPVDESA